MFGIGGNSELKEAKQQRQIQKLKNKTEKEQAKLERYQTNTKIQGQNGGRGISMGVHYADVPKTEDPKKRSFLGRSSTGSKPKAPSKALNGKRRK